MSLFKDRVHAGQQLSKHLKGKIEVDMVVIPYPEAYEVAWEIATSFEADVMLKLSEFIKSSETPFTPIGAVAEDGTVWVENHLKEELKVSSSHVSTSAKIISEDLKRKSTKIKPDRSDEWIEKNVLIISDGISSGFREMAVAGSLLKQGAKNLHIAAPKSSKSAMADLESVVKNVYCLDKPDFINSPSSSYTDEIKIGEQVSRLEGSI